MTLKKGNQKIFFIAIVSLIALLIAFMVYELIARSTGMKSLMGNSVTTSFYYCEDNNYNLDNDKCIKSETTGSNILGDVNLDGKVDDNDINLLNSYLAKTADLSDISLIAADVNSDGILSVGDSENIRLYVTGHNTGSEYLSKIGVALVCPKEYTLKDNNCVKETVVNAKHASYKLGDINLDGSINKNDLDLLDKYLKKQATINVVQTHVADYNSDGTIDANDLYELEEYLKTEINRVKSLGDVSLDGVVDSSDVILLEKYINKNIDLTKEQLDYADINDDGAIDKNDLSSLAKKISDYYSLGDINLDGVVNDLDVTLLQNMLNGVVTANKVQNNLSDINNDSKIDNTDVLELRNKVSKNVKYKKGDVNLDGKITSEDVTIIENYVLKKTELTIDQLNYADYNGDLTVDNKDANSLAKAVAANYKVGDINMDGRLNMADINLLSKYVAKIIDLNTTQKILADKNGDGKINASDLK